MFLPLDITPCSKLMTLKIKTFVVFLVGFSMPVSIEGTERRGHAAGNDTFYEKKEKEMFWLLFSNM